ncbi:hypothetical protein [Evansella cellulosilytica]|uniref:Uncharacterized protein n=1 Tax=Evansella cellulosilytica (strain ATCC 21833 / DSM 2522 / FERM P-1141 / JCM 9156 / N-4) TaxID=649639 RepID=E6TRH4_EVAC2|nr:hypothetical protein [Evansella cellulosilytica]ADU31804.1 hypothetical protein Bcell_3563 [Evansella cellulosilytica DSM 2522]
MLSAYKKEDFFLLEDVAYDRIHPARIFIFFWGVLGASAVVTAVTSFATSYSIYIQAPHWENIVTINYLLLCIQFLVTVFFSFPKTFYRFQRIQMIFVCLFSLKLSIDFYQFIFLIREDRGLPILIDYGMLLIILGGIVFLLFSIARSIKRVKQGHFRHGGKGLYNFQQSKGYVSLPIIFAASMIGGLVARASFETSFGELTELLFFIVVTVVIQYGIAMAWPEFLLIAYCKFRFPSFIVPEEKVDNKKSIKPNANRKKQLQVNQYPLSYWFFRPLTVFRSRASLVSGEKAPFLAVVIVWLQLTLLIFIVFCGLYIRNAMRGVFEVENVIESMSVYLFMASILSLLLLIIFRVCLFAARKLKTI